MFYFLKILHFHTVLYVYVYIKKRSLYLCIRLCSWRIFDTSVCIRGTLFEKRAQVETVERIMEQLKMETLNLIPAVQQYYMHCG